LSFVSLSLSRSLSLSNRVREAQRGNEQKDDIERTPELAFEREKQRQSGKRAAGDGDGDSDGVGDVDD
jgi:hypothetical protein